MCTWCLHATATERVQARPVKFTNSANSWLIALWTQLEQTSLDPRPSACFDKWGQRSLHSPPPFPPPPPPPLFVMKEEWWFGIETWKQRCLTAYFTVWNVTHCDYHWTCLNSYSIWYRCHSWLQHAYSLSLYYTLLLRVSLPFSNSWL